jgi:hypothetical protein
MTSYFGDPHHIELFSIGFDLVRDQLPGRMQQSIPFSSGHTGISAGRRMHGLLKRDSGRSHTRDRKTQVNWL